MMIFERLQRGFEMKKKKKKREGKKNPPFFTSRVFESFEVLQEVKFFIFTFVSSSYAVYNSCCIFHT